MDLPYLEYEPLWDLENMFRTIRIFPDPDDAPVRIGLRAWHFEDVPDYAPISYACGDPNNTTEIEIRLKDDTIDIDLEELRKLSKVAQTETIYTIRRKLRINANLEEALRQFRKTHSVPMWADAICINQTDVKEKAHQVRNMDRVYSRGQHTAIWLGKEKDNSNLAMDILDEWNQHIIDGSKNWEAGIQEPADHVDNLKKRFWEKTNNWTQHWEAMNKFLFRPWFLRRWIIQEVKLAKRHMMWCGERKASILALMLVAVFYIETQSVEKMLTLSPMQNNSISMIMSFQTVMERDAPELSLQNLIGLFNTSMCSDPRDMIYSLLGMTTDVDQNQILFPDYSEENKAIDVFIEAFQHIIRKSRSLDFICYCNHYLPGKAETWLPCYGLKSRACCEGLDYSGLRSPKSHYNVQGSPAYQVSLSTTPQFQIHRPKLPNDEVINILVASGYLVDSIIEVGEMPQSIFKEGRRTRYSDQKTLQLPFSWLELLLKTQPQLDTNKNVLDPNDGFKEWSKAPESFWRALLGNREFVHVGGKCWHQEMPSSWPKIIAERISNPDAPNSNEGVSAEEWRKIYETIFMFAEEHLLFISSRTIGLSRRAVRKGDIICILLGCTLPIILRPHKQNHDQNITGYYFIGECYLDGIMDGEFMKICQEKNTPLQEFPIY